MKRFLKMAFIASVVLFVFIYTKAVAANEKDKYVVSSQSDKYHYPSCRWAQKFSSKNLASFHSAIDALGAGYIPCKVCKPPTKES